MKPTNEFVAGIVVLSQFGSLFTQGLERTGIVSLPDLELQLNLSQQLIEPVISGIGKSQESRFLQVNVNLLLFVKFVCYNDYQQFCNHLTNIENNHNFHICEKIDKSHTRLMSRTGQNSRSNVQQSPYIQLIGQQ